MFRALGLHDVELGHHLTDHRVVRLKWLQHQLHLAMFPNQAKNEHPMTNAFYYLRLSILKMFLQKKKKKRKMFNMSTTILQRKSIYHRQTKS